MTDSLSEKLELYEIETSVSSGTGTIPDGTNTGDIIRWNAISGAWESAVEPFQFKGIVLTPLVAALADIEGGLWYNSSEKSVYVCTDA